MAESNLSARAHDRILKVSRTIATPDVHQIGIVRASSKGALTGWEA